MQRMLAAVTLGCAFPALGCQDQSATAELEALRAQASVERENEELVRSWYAAVDGGDIDAAVNMFHPDLRWYFPSNSTEPVTRESVREHIDGFLAGFPRWTHRIDDLLTVGDKVVVRTVDITTHEGVFQGIPATGNEVRFGVILIVRIQDGKIIELWEEADMLGFMSQLGLQLAPAQ